MTTQNKAIQLFTALLDAYRDEDRRELDAFQKLKMSNDVAEDFTAILLAMKVFVEKVSTWEGDIIEFTHLLNKLAVQYVMENDGEIVDGDADD